MGEILKRDGCPKNKIKIGHRCVPKYCYDFMVDKGITSYPGAAGFIMPDGNMVDTTLREDVLDDHVSSVINYLPKNIEKNFENHEIVIRFCNDCHALRIFCQGGRLYVEAHHRPTAEQIKTLSDILRDRTNPIESFLAEKTDRSCGTAIPNPTPNAILKWIIGCWP